MAGATLYLEMNAERMQAGAAKAAASLRQVQTEARTVGQAMERAAQSNQAYTLSVDAMSGELRRVPVTMAETSRAATLMDAALGTVGKKLTDIGGYARSFASHLKSMLVVAPIFGAIQLGLNLVEDSIRSLFEPTEQETKRMEALAKATKEWKDQLDRRSTLRAITEGDRDDPQRYASNINEQITQLEQLRRQFQEGLVEPSHTIKDLQQIGVHLRDLGTAGEVFEDLEKRTAAWRAELQKIIDRGDLVRQDSITPVPVGTPAAAIEDQAEQYRYGVGGERMLPDRPSLYVPDATVLQAFDAARSKLDSEKASLERGNEAIKARTALLEGLVTGYNRLQGITAEGEKLFGTLTTAGLPRDLAAGAARGVSRLQSFQGAAPSAVDQEADRNARLREQVEAARVARLEALQRAIDASEGKVAAAQPGGARQLQLDNFRALAESAGLAANQVDKVVAAEAGRLDSLDQLKKAEQDAAKAAQDRAQSISTYSNALGAGMGSFIDSLGNGGDAVRAFATSLASSFAQKGIDQLATSVATSFIPSPSTPSYQHGGYNPVTQMALIHAGERVLNVEQTKQYERERHYDPRPAGRAAGPTHVHLHGITDAAGVRRSAYQLARQLERSQERRG